MNERQPYPSVPNRADFPAMEERILARWRRDKTFERSVQARPGRSEGGSDYVFYDGPPFANGLPHFGHLLTGYVKDVVPRYQTMRGRRVERRFGWDCHGLPAEMETEKELGVSGRQAIEEFGIAEFNQACRTSVLRYTSEWQDYVTRQARWVDFDNDYKTMDLPYMESVLWAFKSLYDKGLIYEDYRVLPYSWAAETPLSNHEIRLDDATRPRQDPAITVALELEPAPDDPGPLRLLIWTTTPWTLPSNLAVAVGPEVSYALVRDGEAYYVLAEERLPAYEAQLDPAQVVATMPGRQLVGRSYHPLFDYFAAEPGAFVVLGADFVDTSEGTGVVHLATGFGEEDQKVGAENGIGVVVPVDHRGRFTDEVTDYAGLNVFDANPRIIDDLKKRGVLVRHDSYTHNYPHCWRTDQPIIYRAMSSWFVRTTELRDRMLELNQQINWIPEHLRDGQFGRWLEGVRDWSISRNRFWGSPIPVWRSDDPEHPRVDVYGSLDELERDFGVRPTDLHRPAVDELVRPNPDDPTGRSMMRRVPEVLDCWFESGSMPFAQLHYPFENREWFDEHFPADFIVEYVTQTRGWFYTLHVLATALFDKPAFLNCICHGVLLGDDARKLSKRLRNYADPEEVFATLGSDALRWFLMSSPILRGLDLRIDRQGSGVSEAIRQVLNPIWNAFHFFTLYANVDGHRARFRTDSTQLLDRYILAKTRELVVSVTRRMDTYDVAGACAEVTAFLDALNNWYIRRSRDRFWAPAGSDDPATEASKLDGYDTLFTVLHVLARTTAPLLPFLAEELYTGLTGEDSVHLADWPRAEDMPADAALVQAMDRARDVVSATLKLREEHGLRTRLPLADLVVAGAGLGVVEPLAGLVADEVNVKSVRFDPDLAAHGSFDLKPSGRVLGPRLGAGVQAVLQAAREGAWTARPDGSVEVAGHILAPDEFEMRLQTIGQGATAVLRGNDGLVRLDTTVTAELRAEGWARDIVRIVQQARRDADLEVTDRIELGVVLPGALRSAVEPHRRWIADQVLAVSLELSESDRGSAMLEPLDGEAVSGGRADGDGRAVSSAVLEGEPVQVSLRTVAA
jgi:isoleucyl-tRNA synthetase